MTQCNKILFFPVPGLKRAAEGEDQGPPFPPCRIPPRRASHLGLSPEKLVDTYYRRNNQTAQGAAEAVNDSFDKDYKALASNDWFGIGLPEKNLPCVVYATNGVGGAYHCSCESTKYVVDDDFVTGSARQSAHSALKGAASGAGFYIAPALAVAELVESFEDAKNNGWDCGDTNGEALSRVGAFVLHPEAAGLQGLARPQSDWWSNGHHDYVTSQVGSDTDENANGCGVLFIYYLRDQLGYTMGQIINAGGKNLGETYQKLSGKSGKEGFDDFIKTLSKIEGKNGELNLPAQGNPNGKNPAVPYNPFPIASR